MSHISIVDLDVFYRVGVPDEERAKPQRLLLTVDMRFDFTSAAISGRLMKTIDYHEVSQWLLQLGERRTWKLIELIAMDVADDILAKFHPESVTVEVKKFVIPQASYVSVCLTKERHEPQMIKRSWWWWEWH